MDNDKLQQAAEQFSAKQGIKDMAAGGRPKRKKHDETDEEGVNLEEVKQQLRSAFLGYHYKTQWTDDGPVRVKTWRVEDPDNFTPICNEKALEDFFIEIDSVANIHTSGSNLEAQQIERVGQSIMYSIIDLIVENHNDYNIESFADANAIVDAISVVMMAALSKSKEGWRTEQKTRSLQEKVMRVIGGEDKEEKTMGGIFG